MADRKYEEKTRTNFELPPLQTWVSVSGSEHRAADIRVIGMVVGSQDRSELDALLLSGSLQLWHIVRVDSCCL
jgi:hypothetical protein